MAATTQLSVWNAALREIGAGILIDTTTVNARQRELADAWDHAIEYALAAAEWNFATRRATLAGVASAAFPPYTYVYTRPSNYVRKVWIKSAAVDAHQVDHAESGTSIYGMVLNPVIEYVSDDATATNPANWPPHFTEVVKLRLAGLIAPRVARAGAGDAGMLDGKLQAALADAVAHEAVFRTNVAIPASRQPVMRRALEIMGQVLAGSVPIHDQADKLRWSMHVGWDHAVKTVLEKGAWNFATRRTILTGGAEGMPGDISGSMTIGYSVAPATETDTTVYPAISQYDYGHALPTDFLHKIWLKADANDAFEAPHQFIRHAVFSNYQQIVMEYIAWDDYTTSPTNWPASFLEAVAARLALTVAPELTLEHDTKGRARIQVNEMRGKLEAVYMAALSDAEMRDAIQQFPMQRPPGRFATARMGSTWRRLN